MSTTFIGQVDYNYVPDKNDNVMDSIFKQYERVVVESLITSFGLDIFINDQHGGDVDTVHNVRQIGKDEKMRYKNKQNQKDYENRGAYDSHAYHSDKNYIASNRKVSEQKKAGTLVDGYTNEKIPINGKSDQDHIVSAYEVHNDPGRILAGIKGEDLANSEENLIATNQRTNRTKKADKMDDFLEKYGDEYTEEQKARMLEKDRAARKAIDAKINKEVYTSKKFYTHSAAAAGKLGAKMGAKQVLGFIFSEIWFEARSEFDNLGGDFSLEKLFKAIAHGVKRGYENAKLKYKELIGKFLDGAIAGALSSITTTICNIFFTTAKNVVTIIRKTWSSIVEAAKILFINPDNLKFGDRMRATAKVVATGASIVVGTLVSEALGAVVDKIPVLGGIVQTFCGALVTGIMSCTLLYHLDRSKLMNKLVVFLNDIPTLEKEVNYFIRQAEYFERYAAELMEIDYEQFHKETTMYANIIVAFNEAKNDIELNNILKSAIEKIGIKLPWEGNFDDFMKEKKQKLVFE